ncbi:bifunctional diaminohydroxyphosphoribosylaminopyrimidine deaminase/5-amino-6-(5-phosphoribosylamino)uracil reductase RibD [Orrella marina]|uniref:Riboflavin biosynthesis protein RibD n=2 Tax=Orrella marina TaxID=2163011 RepID=A0A2R4XNA8_9BURK|nr:bifunctional diaminohydroxyphosphoribosylaminopyrimidine deaminase/5-amino-6-(5-phosphoribosylamino)uracil reductase RibD [Orrella marina]
MEQSRCLPDRDDHRWMSRALDLARSVLYVPSPNPRVGCVIVRDGQLLAEGATQLAGQAHAEVMALRELKARGLAASGTTIYVTLEPCSHFGKTPPCVHALIQANPERVVIAHVDPNPSVAGRGVASLRQAGIEVTVGVAAEQALEINPGFVSRMLFGLPYSWVKVAASMDRHTATVNGKSKWITGSEARADGHHWRARSCVVLTGIGTVKADDPQLNVRAVQTPRQPARALIDASLDVPETARLLDEPGLMIFVATADDDKVRRLRDRGAIVVALPDFYQPSYVDLDAVMRWLAKHGFNEVHIEAGARLNGALWRAGRVDELLIYMAPVFLGGGAPMLAIPTIDGLEQASRLTFMDSCQIGEDIRLRARSVDRWEQIRLKVLQANDRWTTG